jgi:hypothetical protein
MCLKTDPNPPAFATASIPHLWILKSPPSPHSQVFS